MTITDLNKDVDAGTMSIVAEFAADAARVWRLWADPRQFERWWGPPSHPATVTDHDLSPGGTVRYFMTGPDGERYHGGWRVSAVAPPHRLEFEDFFADDAGEENTDLPSSKTVVTVEAVDAEFTRMTIATRYASPEAMRLVLEMGMEEGIRQALGQIDDVLTGPVG